MKRIITDLNKLRKASAPLEFITANGETEKTEGIEIIEQLKLILEKKPNLIAIAAPQIGFDKRIFCIRFQDIIKTFINPIITKKSNYNIAPETFSSMPGKEILISRPEEVSVVYYTDEFKYEDNKLLGPAARIFDQQAQLLDGILPDVLGTISDVETDGSLQDLSEEEIEPLIELHKKIIAARTASLKQDIENSADQEILNQYKQLKFSEDVINGRTQVIENPPAMNRAQRRAAQKTAKRLNKVNVKRGK